MKNIINKKRRFLNGFLVPGIVAVATAFSVISCTEDLLEQSNNNGTSTANFGANETQVTKGLNAAYHVFHGSNNYGRPMHVGPLLRDDSFNAFDFGNNTELNGLIATEGERWGLEFFPGFYQAIGRANIVINGDLSAIPEQDVRDRLLGQAYFIRGFAYWNLVNLFGDVPLVLEVADLDNLLVSRTPAAEVNAQIVSDFQEAERLLPVEWGAEDLGRPTTGTAAGFLGKQYLYMEQWANAEAAFRRVVDSGRYGLLPLSQYSDNFTDSNENNMESLYELQFVGTGGGLAWGTDIPGTGAQGQWLIEYAPPSVSPDKGMVVNPWVRELFERPENSTNTARRDASIVYNYPGATGYAGVDYLTDYADDITIANQEQVEPIFIKKLAGHNLGTRAEVVTNNLGQTNGNNWRLMRYADVLLMLAEALNEQGDVAGAATYLNQVRNRAGLANTTAASQADMELAIIEERAMELLGEGHRFFDLVRWGLADDYLGASSLHVTNGSQTYHPKSLIGGTYEEFKALMPLPVGELAANPNLTQNPGY